MMTNKPMMQLLIFSFGALFLLSGCVMKRTVTEDGRVIEQKNVVKRPVRDFINETEFE